MTNKKQPSAAANTPAAAPANFIRCANTACSRAATCLRAKAWSEAGDEVLAAMTLNPRLATGGDDCKYFRLAQTVRRARGFVGLQDMMLPAVYIRFRRLCVSQMSLTRFYRLRKGAEPINATLQAFIANAAQRAGFSGEVRFDAYEDVLDWE